MTASTTYRTLVDEAANDPRTLVRVERSGAVATITMDDAAKYNVLSATLTCQLHEALRALATDPDVRAVILTGADPAFSAGGDVRLMTRAQELLAGGDEGAVGMWRWIRYQFGGIARLLVQTDKVMIAAVNGAAAGVGLAFAYACDLILVSERARIVPAFADIGLVPEVGTSWMLTRRLGYHRAFELFLTGRELSGAEAAAMGLANVCVPHDRLLAEAQVYADRVVALPDPIVTLAKPLLRRTADATWEQAIAMEELAEPLCFTTGGHRAAVARFLGRS
ncbi:MAG TPA: enoyl-CoA hydratase/isomerase family protein [Candidatus Binatia bacterium]|jgi:2-(1,2-epoxy-1,2-dihydrophenyl)acetyl-CoA isomerase|nr:enoyl-CoA hydratase/isomerase family protein [Candidatus Binatia bacterium]